MERQYKALFVMANITILILAVSFIVFQIATKRSIERIENQLNEQSCETYNNRND